MDLNYAITPSNDINDWRIKLYEVDSTGSESLVGTQDVAAPHTTQVVVSFTGLNTVSHYFRLYELVSGVEGALLLQLLTQPISQGVSALDTIELQVGTGYPITANQSDFDGTALFPAYAGMVANVDYKIEQRGIGKLKAVEVINNTDTGVTFGFKLTGGAVFNDGDTYWVIPRPTVTVNPANFTGNTSKWFNGFAIITADTTLNASYNSKIISLQGGSPTLEITMDFLSAVPVNTPFCFNTQGGSQEATTLKTKPGDNFFFNGQQTDTIYMKADEMVMLMKVIDGSTPLYYVFDKQGGWHKVGNPVLSYAQEVNSIPCSGQLVNRSEQPRLTEFVLNLTLGSGVVNEADWTDNKTMYSLGDGTTTIRMPDLRGMFIRSLDAGAGLDSDRVLAGTDYTIASYQADANKEHSHVMPYDLLAGGTGTPANVRRDGTSDRILAGPSTQTEGTEGHPKNIALPIFIYT